jgi:hypothetical protein
MRYVLNVLKVSDAIWRKVQIIVGPEPSDFPRLGWTDSPSIGYRYETVRPMPGRWKIALDQEPHLRIVLTTKPNRPLGRARPQDSESYGYTQE